MDTTHPKKTEENLVGRLINHSKICPNLITKIIPVDKIPQLCFFAHQDIDVDKELLYDYREDDKDIISANPWLTST